MVLARYINPVLGLFWPAVSGSELLLADILKRCQSGSEGNLILLKKVGVQQQSMN